MADIVDLFPRRPIRLAKDKQRTARRLLLLAAALLLALPAFYWGDIAWQRRQLQQDLRARGVQADAVLDAQGDCTARRSRLSGAERPIDCWLTITYRLRPQEGGAVRTAQAHLDGRMPIFTPPAYYDPADPDRVMLKPEMDRSLGWDETLGPLFLLIIPAIVLAIFFLTSRRGLAQAAKDPRPAIVPIEKMIRQGNKLYLHTRPPGAERPSVDSFAAPAAPLLAPPPPGAPPGDQWVLALISPKGRAYALDDKLAWLDLTEIERAALLGVARH
jgi:hypothetical protein